MEQSFTPNTHYTIIVPAWNESACIEDTLKSLSAAVTEVPLCDGIVVVDNNSTDDTASLAKKAGATVVFEPVNQISRARNTGARSTESQWLVFIDADTALTADLLQTAIASLQSGRAIGGGATVRFDQHLTGLSAVLVRVWNWWSVYSSTAAGCFMFCTRDAFEAVGGFDEKQFVAEELYFSRKMKKLAKKQGRGFLIINEHPVLSSARKKDWYSTSQILWQIVLLLLPGASRSKRFCGMWYDRSRLP